MTLGKLAALDGDGLWSLMLAAAGGSRDGLAAVVARQCESGSSPRLGWICPPPWPTVERRIAAIHAACGPPATNGDGTGGALLPLTTGGWSFAASAICETVSQAEPAGLAPPLDSLEPAMIRHALHGAGGRPGAFLAISASGATLETRHLATLVSGQADAVGKPLVWLRDDQEPPAAFALSPRGVPDQVAMLGAPLSTAFLAAAAAADPAGLADAYARLLRRHDHVGAAAAAAAAAVPVAGAPLIHLVVPAWAGDGLRLWLLQAARQVVCGKSSRFRPWVAVAGPGDEHDGCDVRVDLGAATPDLPGLVEIMYRAGIFLGALALRARLPVTEHPGVTAYKERLSGADQGIADVRTVDVASLPATAAGWLTGKPRLTRLHVVRYDSEPRISAERFMSAGGHPCEVHAGSAWNHHSFHAVHADRSVAVLLVVAAPEASAGEPAPLREAARVQRLIAVATHLALPGRSLIVQLRSRI
jgi:hypothetical protein